MVVNRPKIRTIVIVAVAAVFGLSGISYYQSLAYLKVDSTNVSKVSAYTSNNRTSIAYTVTKSGDKLKLRHGEYYLHAYGSSGYADTYIAVTMTKRQQFVTVKSYYSQDHLNSLSTTELPVINTVLSGQFPNLSQYQVQPGSLFHFGEWYGTSLKYVGSDLFNADTLHVILQKSNGQWRVVTAQPAISLSKLLYPSVPKDILDSVNAF
jgi:hypothetical protein